MYWRCAARRGGDERFRVRIAYLCDKNVEPLKAGFPKLYILNGRTKSSKVKLLLFYAVKNKPTVWGCFYFIPGPFWSRSRPRVRGQFGKPCHSYPVMPIV